MAGYPIENGFTGNLMNYLPFDKTNKHKIDKALLCKHCDRIYKQPKLLNCMHPFCLECLEGMLPRPDADAQNVPPPEVEANNQDVEAPQPQAEQPQPAAPVEEPQPPPPPPKKFITCPTCNDVTEITEKIESLPTQYKLQNLIEVLQSNQDGGPRCGECIEKGEVVAYCTRCQVSLCDQCRRDHERQERYKNHKIKEATDVSSEKLLNGRKEYCKDHDDELKYFCKVCQICICRDCPVDEAHQGHEYALIKNVLVAKKQEVDELIKKGWEGHESIKNFLDISKQMVHSSNVEKDKSIEAIHKSFEEMQNMLTLQKEQLIKKVTDNHDAGSKSLENAKKKFNILEELLKYCRDALDMAEQVGNIEVMAELKKQLQYLFTQLDVEKITSTSVALPPDSAATAQPSTEVFGVVTTPFKENKGNVKVEVQKKVLVAMDDRLKQIIETCQKAMDFFNQN